MSNEPVGIAMIGVGNWANVLAQRAAKSRKLTLRSCFSRDAERRASFSEKFGCEQEATYDAVLGRDDVEAVLIATPDDTHADLAQKAAQAGKHVFTEKPMANSVASCRVMIDACHKAGVQLAVGHGHRHASGVREMKRMLDAGELGEPAMAQATFSAAGSHHLTPDLWRYYRDKCPAGPLHPIGVHQIDNLNFLFGPPQRVVANLRQVLGQAEIDDVAQLLIEYPRRVHATLSSSFVSPVVYRLEVYGTEAVASFTCKAPLRGFEDNSALVVLRRGDPTPQSVELSDDDIVLIELEDFADAIRHNRAPACDGQLGLHVISVLEATVRSTTTNAWIALDEL